MWDGFWVVANRRAWEELPPDMQEIVSDNIDKAADSQRADIRKLNESLQGDLEEARHDVQHARTPRPSATCCKKAGYYAKWQQSFGPECWSLLEKYTGPLA